MLNKRLKKKNTFLKFNLIIEPIFCFEVLNVNITSNENRSINVDLFS